MKKLISLIWAALLPLTAVISFTGCDNVRTTPTDGETYYVYTNIPSGVYTLASDNFKLAETIGGASFGAFNGTAAGSSASSKLTTKQKDFYYMDAYAYLVVTADFTDGAVEFAYNSMCAEIDTVLNGLQASVSAHYENSYIYAFNEADAGERVELDKTSYELLTLAEDIYDFTDGYYNPAVYYSVAAYGFYNNAGLSELPDDGVIEQYRALSTSFGDIELYVEDGAYYAVKPESTVIADGVECSLKIDLGGIGKGYAVDAVNALLDEYGFSYGYFNFASSSIAVRSYYKDGNYVLGLTNPRSGNYADAYLKLSVGNVCLSTSGDYEQYYTVDGVRYCHIIDPTTGKPVQKGIMTATVVGGTAAWDDALTTAVMAMGKDFAIDFIAEKLTDRMVVFTYENAD